MDEKSTPEKPILKKLIGRTNDIALLPSGKKSPGLTFYYVTKSIIEDDGNVQEFVIKQTKIDTFEIEYVSRIALTESQIKDIEKAIETYLESGLTFHFSRKEKLVRSKSGKLKQLPVINAYELRSRLCRGPLEHKGHGGRVVIAGGANGMQHDQHYLS